MARKDLRFAQCCDNSDHESFNITPKCSSTKFKEPNANLRSFEKADNSCNKTIVSSNLFETVCFFDLNNM